MRGTDQHLLHVFVAGKAPEEVWFPVQQKVFVLMINLEESANHSLQVRPEAIRLIDRTHHDSDFHKLLPTSTVAVFGYIFAIAARTLPVEMTCASQDPFERHQRPIERANNKNQYGEPETDPAHNRADLSYSTHPPDDASDEREADRQSHERAHRPPFRTRRFAARIVDFTLI
jgi:hypothetical protein